MGDDVDDDEDAGIYDDDDTGDVEDDDEDDEDTVNEGQRAASASDKLAVSDLPGDEMNNMEIPLFILGMIGAAVAGAAVPLLALVFSDLMGDIFAPCNKEPVRRSAIYFVLIRCLSFGGNVLQHNFMGMSGGRLTKKLRSVTFRALLKQEIGFFNAKENSVGQLTARLATEATLVQELAQHFLRPAGRRQRNNDRQG